MAKRGGFPGGMGMPGNMNNLMKQAQKMQRQMEENQDAIDPEDVETLEEMIQIAVNQVLRQQEEDSASMMSGLTGGLGGGFPF